MTLLLLLACSRAAPPAGGPDDSPPADSAGPDDTAPDDTGAPDDTAPDDSAPGDSGPDDSGEPPPDGREAAAQAMVDAAAAFLAALDATQLEAVTFPLDDPERWDWSNLPVPNYPRRGLALGEMDEPQRELAYALLAATLSADGYTTFTGIIAVDELLRESGQAVMGEDWYTFGVFGTPSMTEPWGWQIDGHHMAINVTAWGDEVVMVPALKGVNPTVWSGGASDGLRPLAAEEDLAWALVETLDADQLAVAHLSDTLPGDILAGPTNDDGFPSYEGLPASALTADQRAALLDLIAAYVLDQADAFGAVRLADIEAGLDAVHLAWMGETGWGGRMYYRVHGPTLLIEFDHVNGGDHIHAVYRDPTDDYGAGLLAEHYARHPH